MLNLKGKLAFTAQTLTGFLNPALIQRNISLIPTIITLKSSFPHFRVYLTAPNDNPLNLNQMMNILKY